MLSNRPRHWAIATVLAAGALSPAWAFDPLQGDLSRAHPADVRVVSYNHYRRFIAEPAYDATFGRILTALDPDVVCFQEFTGSVTQADMVKRMNAILPPGKGQSWNAHLGLLGGIRTAIVARHPLTLTRQDTDPESSTRGVTIALIDLPAPTYCRDLYLLGVHLKCCGNEGGSEDASRQRSADAIVNWMGDARGVSRPSGEQVSLPAGTPMLALGDFNLVGGPQPEGTLITGDIQDEGEFGSDVAGDWDASSLLNVTPADPFTGDTFTWQGNSNFPPSALDRFFLTDSAVIIANTFVLNTNTMTAPALAAAGLQAGDTLRKNASDHLPIVIDLRISGTDCVTASDCDDSLFCNGVEICNCGSCEPGSTPCSGAQWCDEKGDACVTYGNGDFEPDGDVDLVDLAGFLRCIGTVLDNSCQPANLTGADGTIDEADLAALLNILTGP